ncbi:MAG: hypothetical protein RR585_14695 [Coprobacillus sp.]
MENKSFVYVVVGALIYMIVSAIDRFLLPVENIIYIPVVIVAVIFMLIGIIKKGRD